MLPDTPPDRFELLLDLYAPVCEDDETGTQYRDPGVGIITYDELMCALNADAGAA